MLVQALLAALDLQTWLTDCCSQLRSTDFSVKVTEASFFFLFFYPLAAAGYIIFPRKCQRRPVEVKQQYVAASIRLKSSYTKSIKRGRSVFFFFSTCILTNNNMRISGFNKTVQTVYFP